MATSTQAPVPSTIPSVQSTADSTALPADPTIKQQPNGTAPTVSAVTAVNGIAPAPTPTPAPAPTNGTSLNAAATATTAGTMEQKSTTTATTTTAAKDTAAATLGAEQRGKDGK